jgi:phage-related minor tail protein
MSLGSLVLELQGNVAKTQEDMGRLNQIVESAMSRIDATARRTSANISGVATAAGSIRRVEGASQVAADLDRVAHSSTGARRELLVLTHELATGNFRRAGGSLLVLAERLDIMGAIMSPLGLAIGGVAVAIGVLAIGAIKGAEESRAFANSLTLTGNYAGLTEGRFNALAESISKTTGATIGSSREMTQALVSTGRFGQDSIGQITLAATRLQAVSGQSTEEVVKDFSRMSEGALKWATEANQQYHFLNGSTYDYIKSLEDQGKEEQAELAVAKALYDHLGGDSVQQLGLLEQGWQNLKEAMSAAKDELLAIGRTSTPEQSIAELRAQQARIQGARGGGAGGVNSDIYDSQYADVTNQIGRLTAAQRNQQDNASLTSTRKAHDDQVVEAKTYWDKLLETTKTGAEQLQEQLAKIQREGTLAGASPADIAAEQERVRKQYAPKGQGGLDRANLDSVTQPLQEQINAEDKLLSYREQVLERYYKSDLISTQGYYDTRAVVIEANSKRVQGLYDQEIAAYQKRADTTTGAQSVSAENKANELRNAQQQALLRTGEQLADTTSQQTQAARAYADEVEKLDSLLGRLNHTQAGQNAGADFDRSHEHLRAQATISGDTGTLDSLDQARDLSVAQAQLNALKQQGEQIERSLALAEKQNALDTQAGQQGEIEAELKLGQMRALASTQLADISARMQQVASASGSVDLKNQAGEFSTQAQQLAQSSNVIGNSVESVFQNQFAKGLDNAITRTKSLKKEFQDMAQSIEQSISQIVSKDLANQLFGNIGGGGSGQGGGGGGLIGSLVGMVMGFFGGGDGSENLGASATSTPDDLISGYRATGGPTLAGGMYEVNERGPELLSVANRTFLMMGQNDGKVTPMGGSASMSGGNTYHMNIAVPPGTSRATANQQASAIMRQAQVAQARNK